jgi:arylsulfatase B
VNDAIAWIGARGTQPWFVWLALNAPHTPLHKPPNALHSYDALPGTTPHINNNPRLYYEAALEAADTELGRLLAAVDRAKTDIILIGDNGTPPNTIQAPHPSSHAKDTLYEGGIRVPFLINGPSVVRPGRTSDSPVQAVDLFATILELAGISPAAVVPSGVITDSRSLLPLIADQAESEARYAYAELFGSSIQSVEGGQALRNGQFKLIRFVDRHEEFYDLAADPAETNNLLTIGLSGAPLANYYALKLRLADYQDEIAVPQISTISAGVDGFSVTVVRDAALTYSLWRSSELSGLSWAPVSGASIVTGSTTVRLSDAAAMSGRGYYRVVGEK